ncbi:ParA family protein [Rhodopila globiformis]|uniref:Chromosome partitioning protein ParA n=1 Tax=Rhodopila globiformis TaxID=1071 RepID=A0A2S6NBB7_RHOGL|nr:ParA family protein [Rhodopila globiformis]PPQ31922.1 chromosome partitioning protein ParA [Rhodopila globiformis]
MPTIAFASPKGGSGKSTSAVLLGIDLAERGATVTLIDADPNHPLLRWSRRPGVPATLTVVACHGEEQLVDAIELAARQTAFVIVDLEGTATSAVGVAMSRADLVIIPTKGSDLDAAEAVKAIKFLRFQEKAYRRSIPFAVLFTQTRPAIRPKTQINIEQQLAEQAIPMFATQLHERDPYRAVFSFGGTLRDLLDNKAMRGVDTAISNVRLFSNEVVAQLDRITAVAEAVR